MQVISGQSLGKFFYKLITKYSNLNYSRNYDVLGLIALAIQVITGILLAMFYTAHTE